MRAAMAAAVAFIALPLTAASEERSEAIIGAPDPSDGDGRDTRSQPTRRPTVEAAFARESYASGDLARLVVWTRARQASVQVFQAGTEEVSIVRRDVMLGSPVSEERRIGDVENGDVIGLRIDSWPSGLYFAKLTAAGRKIGYAPFVLRPRSFGENSVAVVFPTMTWQAYNFHDDNGDGVPDTWYQDQNRRLTARLNRPYENRGVIPHYKYYDQPFVRWLVANHPEVDYFADADLDRAATTGRKLAAAYELIVFPGHHEYVTRHEYDVVTRFRDLGGNLIFLSANNFYRLTVKDGNVMRREARWRDLGRPEAALVGTQYFGNDTGEHRGAWIVREEPRGRVALRGNEAAAGCAVRLRRHRGR